MATDVTGALLEVVVGGTDGIQVASALLEVVVAPDVDSTKVTGAFLEVVVAPDAATGPGGVGGTCPGTEPGVRLWWALDIELAGIEHHFATEPCEVAGVTYRGGLGQLALSRLDELGQPVELTITSADPWARSFATARWLVDGGRATLWLVVSDRGTLRRELWAEGRVDGTRWGLQHEPLTCQLAPTGGVPTVPNPRERVDSSIRPADPDDDAGLQLLLDNFSEAGPYGVWPDSYGLFYPIVIGYPGHIDGADYPECVVPAPIVQVTRTTVTVWESVGNPSHPISWPSIYIYVISSGDIDAEKVWYLDTGVRSEFVKLAGADPNDENTSVFLPMAEPDETNDLGRGPDLVGQITTWYWRRLGHGVDEGTPTIYVGFSKSSGYGGGIKHLGRLVRGAADIFEWLVDTCTTARFDRGRHRAGAARLNAYLFDTWINETAEAFDWFQSAILDYVPAAIVRGEDGIYLAPLPLSASAVDVVADLVEGRNATRVGMAVTDAADVVNELTFSWGPMRDDSAYAFTRILTREFRRPQPLPGGGYYGDERALPNALCAESQHSYGVRHGTLELPTIWDPSTAQQVAEDYVTRRAFPERTLTYTLRTADYRIMPGDVVRLTDAGLSIDGVLCTVLDVRLSVTDVEVVLRPIRTLSNYL